MKCANLIIECLQRHGVKLVFGYPGGAIMPLYDAIHQSNLTHLLARHEQGAAMEALGYARAGNQVGVCIATSGPGATNLITGLADAYMDSVPVIAITGQVASHLLGTDGFQEIDTLGLSLACTKHSYIVNNPLDIPKIIEEAFIIATSGRPGPVLIDIPRDIQLADIKLEDIDLSHIHKFKTIEPEKQSINNLELAKELFLKSEKPILYVGGGVQLSGTVDDINTFLEITQIPAVSTLKGLGSVNPNYKYYLGMLGMHGLKHANYTVQECDLLIVAGARFDDRVTGKLQEFAPHAKVIHIDIDIAEINKIRKADISLIGSLKEAINYLTIKPIIDLNNWREKVFNLKNTHSMNYAYNDQLDVVDPIYLLHRLSSKLKKTDIVTTDVGQHQMWAAQHMVHYDPSQFISSSGLGTMGFGLPAAIGAKAARPNNEVVCVTGDGSILMNIQELATSIRGNLPIKIVLLDNNRLGMVRQWQQLFFSERYSETILDDNPDFVMLAKSFYYEAKSIYKMEDVEQALDEMLESKKGYLLHVRVHESHNVWPLVAPGTANHEMLDC